MNSPKVVSRAEWLAARKGLLQKKTTYTYLDLTALGRHESQEGNPQAWIRHHDKHPT